MLQATIRAALICPASIALFAVVAGAPGAVNTPHSPAEPACLQIPSAADPGRADELLRGIVDRYNKDDFRGIYGLASEEFKRGVSEEKFVLFLRRNRNGGDILRSSLKAGEGNVATYLLEMQARDMLLNLSVEPPGRFNSFGLRNSPVPRLASGREVKNDNSLATPLDRAVDAAARNYFRDPHAVGLSIGVIRDGRKYAYHYGQISKDGGALPTSATLYEIGSVTKTMTATLLAQAVIDQRVGLDDDVRKYLGQGYPNLECGGRPISLRDLANHTSRLPMLPDDVGSQARANPLTPESGYDDAMFDAALRRVRLDGRPGEKFAYSNWGAALLGRLLERAYGETYGALLARHITGPLRMTSTTYKPTERRRDRAAVGHFANGKVAPYHDSGAFGPAGDVLSDLDDMLSYLEAQLSEELAAIALTHQPGPNGMGLGWGVRTRDGRREIQHNGSSNGFTSHVSGFLDSRSGCVILTNGKVELGELIGAIQGELKKP